MLRLAGRVLERISAITRTEPLISEELAAIVTANIVCRSDKAMRELGYRPASVETMLKDCIDWMVAENLITVRTAPR